MAQNRTTYRGAMAAAPARSVRGEHTAGRGNNKTVSTGRPAGGRRQDYLYGNAAPDIDVRDQLEQAPRRALSNEARKNREKAHHMSLGYVLFLMAAMCLAGLVLINYIQLQADITTRLENIARLDQELNNLKLSNDEKLNNITSNIDMEEIKRIAIGELGMTYAQEGQIETYTNEGNDYMRRVAQD